MYAPNTIKINPKIFLPECFPFSELRLVTFLFESVELVFIFETLLNLATRSITDAYKRTTKLIATMAVAGRKSIMPIG